jgi:hypothetical protein
VVVSYLKETYKTNGSDFCCSLTLVDPSWVPSSPLEDGLKCQLFHREPSALPPDGAVLGDIVRLHRVKVVRYNGALQVQKSKGFSSLTFDGRVGASAQPRQPHTPNWSWTTQDDRKLAELRDWANRQQGLGVDSTLVLVEELVGPQACHCLFSHTFPTPFPHFVRCSRWWGLTHASPTHLEGWHAGGPTLPPLHLSAGRPPYDPLRL